VGNRDADQGHQERRSLITGAATRPLGLGNPWGRRTSLTAQVLLRSAVAALAIPTALRSTEALPAVESKPASPGLGHRGLLGLEPGRIGEGNPQGPDARQHPAGVVQLLGGGHPVQLGQEFLAVPVAVLGTQGRAADRTAQLAHQVG
jgi:hypothetical protein